VRGSRRIGKEADDFRAEHGALELWPQVNQPREMKLERQRASENAGRRLRRVEIAATSALRMDFAGAKKGEGGKMQRAETLGAGRIEWTDAAPQSGTPGAAANSEAAHTKLQADKLEMEFGKEGKPRQLVATR